MHEEEIMKRRTMLRGLLGVLSTAVAGASIAQVNPITNKRATKSAIADTGMSPEAILSATRLNLGLQTAADITDEASNKIRVADGLSVSLSVNELDDEEGRINIYATNTLFELMGSGAYTHQSQVDMKFIYIPAVEEIASTISALKDRSIDSSAAKLAIRSTFGRYLEGLEQIPTI